jgi:hypothetical protein
MSIKQVRTKNNKYNTVKYDSAGNILTPARIKELRKLSKKKPIKNTKLPKWIKLISQYNSNCCVCNDKIFMGTEILWNKKNKKTKHQKCAK